MKSKTFSSEHKLQVFINCPFDEEYKPMFDAIIFTVLSCGFIARASLENISASSRIERIVQLISACQLGIHDISSPCVDAYSAPPRFNMPFELGLFIGAERFGRAKNKNALILIDKSQEYQKFISDLSGRDVNSHRNDPKNAVRIIRDWLSEFSGDAPPESGAIWKQYKRFSEDLPVICKKLRLSPHRLAFEDYSIIVFRWVADQESESLD